MGLSAQSAKDMFWMGTFFLSGEHVAAGAISQPDAPLSASLRAPPAEEAASPASGLDDLFGKLSITDAATTDDLCSNVEVIDYPLPPAASDAPIGTPYAGIIAEVMVTSRTGDSVGAALDPLRSAL